MLRFRPEARVGLVIFVGVLALIIIYWFLGGWRLRARTYTVYVIFRNIQRLSEGAEVRMAGVPIGKVSRISLWRASRARVEMIVREDVKIPVGSAFRVTSGGLVGDVYVEVVPAQPEGKYVEPGGTVYGRDTITLEQLLPRVNELMTQLQTSASSLNEILGDERTVAGIRHVVASSEKATEQAAALMSDLRIATARNTDTVEALLEDAASASKSFAAVAESLRTALAEGGAQDLRGILESGRTAAENLEETSAKLKQLTEDQQVSEDIKATISNLREASESAKALTDRLGKIVGSRREPRERTRVPDAGARLDTFVGFENGPFYRFDYNLTLPADRGRFYRLGLYNIGESTKLNLQAGRMITPDLSLRYGLYAGRIGLGFDRFFNDRASFHADLFRPNDLQVEVKGLYRLSEDFGLWAGVDNLLDDGSVLLGAQYRQ